MEFENSVVFVGWMNPSVVFDAISVVYTLMTDSHVSSVRLLIMQTCSGEVQHLTERDLGTRQHCLELELERG